MISTNRWIAADWGTSNLRIWILDGDEVCGTADSAAGMGALSREAFEPALRDLAEPWLGDGTTSVIVCGMAGARQGWAEAGYGKVPCAPLAAPTTRPELTDGRMSAVILGGLCQDRPADVMRGEETQIAGVLHARPGFSGVVCLPGTHTKWARVADGEVLHFATFMTGELFALLAERSVLRHSLATEGWDMAAFLTAVEDAIARPERLGAALFSVRAEHLLSGLPAEAGRGRVSGTLMGAELAAARPYWLGEEVVLVGTGALRRAYAAALGRLGVPVSEIDGGAAVLEGLKAARRRLSGEEAKQGEGAWTVN